VATNKQATVEVFLDCNNGNGVSHVVRAEMLQDSLKQRVSCWLELSVVQLSEVR
jgi:hypothetical protein